VLSWISTTPYEKHYKAAKDGLLEDSGGWLFDNSLFRSWLDFNSSGLLWLRGKREFDHLTRTTTSLAMKV
jgi:hypothetical protein